MSSLNQETSHLPESALASEDWMIAGADDPRPASLMIVLRRKTWVLPWFRFAYADCDNNCVVLTFGMHVVRVDGHGLSALTEGVATHRVSRLIQPTENEAKYGVRGLRAEKFIGPSITALDVTELKA